MAENSIVHVESSSSEARGAIRAAACWAVCALLTAAPAGAQTTATAQSWLVVPFELATPTARTYWLGEGVAVLAGDELEQLGIPVLSREARVGALDELRLPASVTLSRATYIRVSELLGAAVTVIGTVTTDESSITVSAQRLELDTGRLAPEVVERGKLVDLFTVVRRLVQRLSGRQDGATTAAVQPPPPLEAFEAYVKGLLADRPDARVRLLEAARARAPHYDRIRLALWAAHTDQGDHVQALAAVQAVPEASTSRRVAQFNAARSLIELKRYDDAFAALQGLAAVRPHAAVFNNLGVVQLRRGATPHTGRATYYFNKAVELEPNDGDLFFNLGYAYWEERDAQAAIYWLREALRRHPADADAHQVIAAALDATGAAVEAGRERVLAEHLSARYSEANRRAGDPVPKGLERIEESLSPLHAMRFDAALTAAQRDQQELLDFHLDRARRFIEQGRDGDAEPELRRVLFLSPYHVEAHLLMGRVYRRSGRLRDAIAAFRISLWSEETAAAHVALAEALLESQDRAAARGAVQRALSLEPENADARALKAHLDALPPP
jgi:tetratricopeptide (TPR) repeat protein